MSYDLQVYSRGALTEDALRALVDESAGLSVDVDAGRWFVSHGVRQQYSFTIDGPYRLEPEDVPPEVTSSVLGARYLYLVAVEGTTAFGIRQAVPFAKRLARALDGAVVDEQTDEIWSRSGSRKIQKPSREERVTAVDLNWFSLRDDLPSDPAALLISAAERYLPEAVPRRFGEYEPLQGNYAEAGREGFSRAWRDATTSLFFSSSAPCVGGSVSAGPNQQYSDRYWSMRLTFLADPLMDPAWRDAARRLFTTLADDLHAFYASAQVLRNHIWSGRGLCSDGKSESEIRVLHSLEGWLGLPPAPPWWSWFGPPYAFVVRLLPNEGLTATGSGTLFESSQEPAPSDSLEPLSRWLPMNLFASIAPNPLDARPIPLIRASTIPDQLI